MIFRLIYVIWMIGAIVVLSRGLSQILFGRSTAGPKHFVRALFMAAIWPVAAMTPEGRAALRALARSD
jgi:hypothetical protein